MAFDRKEWKAELVSQGELFIDLYDHLQSNKIPLWLSVPGNAWGSVLGNANVNVATFNLGRDKPGGDAICFVAVDEAISDAVLAETPLGPIGLTILAEAGLFSGAAFLMGRIGEVQLAAHTVALQIAALAFQVPFGVAQAATIRVGLAYGAGDHAGIARAGRAAMICGIGFMALTAGCIWLFPRALISVYVNVNDPINATTIEFAINYLAIAAAFQLFDGAQAVGAGILRGLQDTRTPMLMAISGYWVVGYGCAIWLGFYTPLSGIGVWIGLAAGLVVVSAMLLSRWAMRARRWNNWATRMNSFHSLWRIACGRVQAERLVRSMWRRRSCARRSRAFADC